MEQNEIKLGWKGEIIKQEVKVPDMEITPKQLLDSLDQARNQITQMYQEEGQIENNLKQTKSNIESATAFVKEREVFEEACLDIQMKKLHHYINQIKDECKTEAENKTKETINESPDAYTKDQKANMSYVMYQRLIATNKKIAENIGTRLITEHLFKTPVFENPFNVK